MTPNFCSLYAVYIETLASAVADGDPRVLTTGTGCLYRHLGRTYLISNWHVFSGRKTSDRQPLHPSGGIPSHIRVRFPRRHDLTEQLSVTYELESSIGLYKWLEHPLASRVDVAALEIMPPAEMATQYVNEAMSVSGLGPRRDFLTVSQEVWVIGFPLRISSRGMPIWKRATIASEPEFTEIEQPHRFLLDTATREGMSGSPVLVTSKPTTRVKFDGSGHEVHLPSIRLLLGIYSGRILGEDEFAAQLGIVWEAECIPEILDSGRIYEGV